MTNRFLISAAVAALIAGTGFANAQGTGNQGTGTQGGSISREAPAAGSTAQPGASSSERGGAASGTMQREGGGASGMKGAESTGTKNPDTSGMKASESNEKMPSGKSAQDTKSPAGEKSKSMSSETGTATGDKDMKAEGRDSKGGMDSKSASDSKGVTDSKSQTTGNAATSATAAPPAEKRTQIVSAIKTEKIEQTTNVNFNITVGAMVPSTVRFHPLPPRIVEIYPEWRGYEVILVSGRYIIVRPRTHEIVYIIEG